MVLPLSPAAASDVVFLGEVHDNPEAHALQARLLAEVAPSAVVFEMFPPDAEAALAGIDRTDRAAMQAALGWEDRGWPDFDTYWPIFEAAGVAPIYGGGTMRTDVRLAMTEGAGAPGQGNDPFGLSDPLPSDQQAAREALQMTAHCDLLPDHILPGMVEAQRYRDAALAGAALRALDETGGPVVVITGNGHARNDWGAPALLVTARPGLTVRSIGIYEEGALPEVKLHDETRTVPEAERDDPCSVFWSR